MKEVDSYQTFEKAQIASLPPPAVVKKTERPSFDWLTVLLFSVWWALSATYNVDNKVAIKMTPTPMSIGTCQMLIGWFWFIPLWVTGLRKRPSFYTWRTFAETMGPQGFFHAVAHMGGIAAVGSGNVSFAHIIKAAEPVTTAFLTVLVFHHFYHWLTYLTLIPIIGGVAFASKSDGTFTWYACGTAMISNIGSSARGTYAKKTMTDKDKVGRNLDSTNQYAILTIIGTIICIVCSLIFEGTSFFTKFGKGVNVSDTDMPRSIWAALWPILTSSLYYYAYNEVAFMALSRVNQLTHAVVNTVRRVVCIAAVVIVLNEMWSWQTVVGATVAIVGTFFFSVCLTKFG